MFSGIGVTLTTLALSRIPRHQRVDASGLHTLARHTGGSLGLALFAALLTHDAIHARSTLLPYVSDGRPEVLEYLRAEEARLMAWGLEPGAIRGVTLSMLDITVNRFAMLLAFEKLFFLIGVLFLGLLPFTLLLRRGRAS